MVLKPSELAPSTSAALAKLIPNYLDTKAIRIVEGGVRESTLLLEQKWDKIFFTGQCDYLLLIIFFLCGVQLLIFTYTHVAGSSAVGRVVMAAAIKHLTPVILELGGKCPVLVDSTVDLDVRQSI